MNRTIVATVLALASTGVGTAVHAEEDWIPEPGPLSVDFGVDDPELSTAAVSYAPSAHFEQDLNYFRCTTGMPPICWKVSTLTFYTHVDLGYRVHRFKGKTAITYGSILWWEWAPKVHSAVCRMEDGTSCGGFTGIPVKKTWETADPAMVPDQFPSPGFIRERYSSCYKSACAYVVRRSPTIKCFAKKEQCYFVHD